MKHNGYTGGNSIRTDALYNVGLRPLEYGRSTSAVGLSATEISVVATDIQMREQLLELNR